MTTTKLKKRSGDSCFALPLCIGFLSPPELINLLHSTTSFVVHQTADEARPKNLFIVVCNEETKKKNQRLNFDYDAIWWASKWNGSTHAFRFPAVLVASWSLMTVGLDGWLSNTRSGEILEWRVSFFLSDCARLSVALLLVTRQSFLSIVAELPLAFCSQLFPLMTALGVFPYILSAWNVRWRDLLSASH